MANTPIPASSANASSVAGAWRPAVACAMGDLIRTFDWSSTPLGPLSSWPAALRISIDQILASRFAQCVVWGDERTMLYNDSFRVLLGDKPVALGRPFHEVWSEVWHALDGHVQRAFAGETTFIEDFELTIQRGNGAEQAFFTFCYSPLRDEHGRICAMLDTMIETTDRLAVEWTLSQSAQTLTREVARRTLELTTANAALSVALDEATAATRAKTAFLANMSHEIRTPLNGILGLAHLMSLDPRDERQRDRLSKIDASGKHLLRMLSDILDLSRIEADKMTLAEIDFDVAAIVRSTVAMIEQQAFDKGLALLVDDYCELQAVRGDPTRFAQMLLNLLFNAIKFTDRGFVRVKCEIVEEDAASCLIKISVIDSGAGVPLELQSRLFSDFEQGDMSTSRKAAGSGLGLSLTRKLARAMDGDAGVQSNTAEGSTFWFTVRLKRTAQVDPENRRGDSSDSLQALKQHVGASPRILRVLLAEDNLVNQEVALSLLEAAGLAVDTARNGREAVHKAAMQTYDLILMDVQMPGMGGIEAAATIGSALRTAPPIIALTASALAEEREACLKAGMVEHLTKPIDPPLLYSAVLRWLSPDFRQAEPGRPETDLS